MRYDVFISYSRSDSELAIRIQEYLTAAGFECFRDESDIPGSQRWVEVITAAIDDSHAVVMVLSRNCIGSDHENARREIHYTIESRKPVVPVLLSKNLVLPREWRYYLAELNYLFADGPIDAALPGIREAVAQRVDQSKHQAEYQDEQDVLRRSNYHRDVELAGDRLGLPVGDLEDGNGTVEGSCYVLQSKPEKFLGHQMDVLPLTSEFSLEGRVRKRAGPNEECFGFEFGANYPGDYYQFLLNGAGTLRIARHLESGWTDLAVAHEVAKQAGESNLLKVVRSGKLAHVFVNGLYAASIRDFQVRTGRPGLVIGRDTRIEFSQMSVRGLSLEGVFREAIDNWLQFETAAAKDLLIYIDRYDPDFRIAGWTKAGQLLKEVQPDRHHTVLLVIGAGATSQFHDGFYAGRLRSEIDKIRTEMDATVSQHAYRWVAVVTDSIMPSGSPRLECPLIAVGGPASNQITATLQDALPRVETGDENLHVQHDLDSSGRRMALWGPMASDTADAVEYAISSGLLERFLSSIWRD